MNKAMEQIARTVWAKAWSVFLATKGNIDEPIMFKHLIGLTFTRRVRPYTLKLKINAVDYDGACEENIYEGKFVEPVVHLRVLEAQLGWDKDVPTWTSPDFEPMTIPDQTICSPHQTCQPPSWEPRSWQWWRRLRWWRPRGGGRGGGGGGDE